MRIDAHQHFWRYNGEEYGWIGDEMRALRRVFVPEHLLGELQGASIDGSICVQARQSLAETVWLLDLADEYGFLRGVIGWVPLTAPDIANVLARLASQKKLKGVRHVLQDEAPEYLSQPEFLRGIGALATHKLVYDLLLYPRHLPAATALVDRFPQQRFVLNHLAKPPIRDGQREPWAHDLRELARRPNVYCKLSGIVTEADWEAWTEPGLWPYLETALEAFGAKRLLFGSDWPVCLAAAGYSQWVETVERFIAALSVEEQERIMGETAREVYSL